MSRGIRILTAVAVLALTAGCGSGDEGTDEAAPSPTPSSSAPTPAESDDCRAAIDAAGGIAAEMETTSVTDARQFTQVFDRLVVLQKQADRACSETVMAPLSKGVYELAKANAGYTVCEFAELCGRAEIERDLIRGTGKIRDAVAAANRTD